MEVTDSQNNTSLQQYTIWIFYATINSALLKSSVFLVSQFHVSTIFQGKVW